MANELGNHRISPPPSYSGWTWLFVVASIIFFTAMIGQTIKRDKLQDRLDSSERETEAERDRFASLSVRCDKLIAAELLMRGERDLTILANARLTIDLDACRECRDAYRDALTECQHGEKPMPILPRPDVPPPADVDPPVPVEIKGNFKPEPDVKISAPELCPCGCGRLKKDCPCCQKHDKHEKREHHKKPEKKRA